MSDIERIAFNWLVRRGVDFQFQTSLMGGIFSLGGAVVDFIIGLIVWRVMGTYWHQGVEKTGQDTIQKELLIAMGYTVVDIWAEDLENRAEQTLTLALSGEEMLR